MGISQALASVTLALVLAGCAGASVSPSVSGQSYRPSEGSTDAFLALVDSTADRARQNGASDAQLADIEVARSLGEVTFEIHASAMNRVEGCLMEWGEFEFVRQMESQAGVMWIGGYINYPPGMADSEASAIYDQCEFQEASFINTIYASQPASVEAFSDLVEQNDEAIRDCLVAEGVAPSELETTADLVEQSQRITFEQAELGMADPVDCLAESGVSW